MTRLRFSGVCLGLGIGALCFLLRYGHRVPTLGPHGDTIMAVVALTFICASTTAVILLASWYGGKNPAMKIDLNPGMSEETLRLGMKAGVYGLHPGSSYRVIREIKDCYGTIFPVGTELTFVQRHYLPYHGGHTVVFRPRPMYLQDETNADVLNGLDSYLETVASPGR